MQDRVFVGVVFQIGALNQNEIANGFRNATTEGGSVSHDVGLHEDAHLQNGLGLDVPVRHRVSAGIEPSREIENEQHNQGIPTDFFRTSRRRSDSS